VNWTNPIRRLKSWFRITGVFLHRLIDTLRPRRLTVIHQMSAVECGAACLSMILTYYGRRTSVNDCRNKLDVGRDGLSALTIVKAARANGLRVSAYSLNPPDFQFVQVPAIVHWNFNHFVVVERWSRGKVIIVDPAVGRVSMSAEEFDAGFTGVVLMFEPGVHFERTWPVHQSLWRRYFLKYIAKSPRLLLQIIGATLLLQALGLAFPIFTKVLVDYVLPFQVRGILTICGLGMVLLVIAQVVTSYTRGALLLFIQTRLDSQMMLDFFEHLLSLPFKFFQQRSSGDLLMRLSSNAVIREILTSQTLSVILDGSLVLIYLMIIFSQASAFGFIVLAIGLLQVSLLLVTTRRVHALMQSDLTAQSKSQSYLVEALTRIEAIKSAGAEERTLEHWSNLFFAQINISLQRGHLSILIDTGMMTLRLFSPLVLVWFGAYRVLDGSMSLGTMLALNSLAGAFLSPLSSLVSNGQRLQLAGSHLERVEDVLEAEPEQINSGNNEVSLSGRVELTNVSFRYDLNAPEVLKNISLHIDAGQKLAIVGRTGSGKSTLGKLLLGLYPPTDGRITYDGIPLESINCRELRRQFGVVLQDSLLFSGSAGAD
jgi:ATP-binding cassette subfamily B protein